MMRLSHHHQKAYQRSFSGSSVKPYLEAIRRELASFGFSFRVEQRSKRVSTAVESAFIKGGTRVNLAHVGMPDYLQERLPRLQQVRVRLDVDTDPPPLARYEVLTLLTPIPFQVRLFALPSLFAGKLHAILCRDWTARVKGRDFYDFIWYLGREPAAMSGTCRRAWNRPVTGKATKTLTSCTCAGS